MTHDAYIRGLGFYVPETVVTNADLEKIVETTDEWITTRTGIKTGIGTYSLASRSSCSRASSEKAFSWTARWLERSKRSNPPFDSRIELSNHSSRMLFRKRHSFESLVPGICSSCAHL